MILATIAAGIDIPPTRKDEAIDKVEQAIGLGLMGR
jgi:hypothetical protein